MRAATEPTMRGGLARGQSHHCEGVEGRGLGDQDGHKGGQSILCAKAPSLNCVGGQVKNGTCICPRGTDRKQTGPNAFSCEPKAPPVTCIGGKIRDGKCVCPGGFERKQTGTNAFRCELKAGVGVLPSTPAQPSQPPPATIPQLRPIPGRPLQIICPTGTTWSDTYKKCMPRID
jgi:hypothetical protein